MIAKIFVEPITLSVRSFQITFPQKLIQMCSWQELNTEGKVKDIKLGNSDNFLNLEDFRSTNRTNRYVYLLTDNTASKFVKLGGLEGDSIGNQNFGIPIETDQSKYDTVLILCREISVILGSAQLEQVWSSVRKRRIFI